MITWKGKIHPDHHVSYAFTCGDTNYFNFTDAFQIPCERAMDAMHIYQEFKNRIDDEFLKAHCTAKQNLYKKNPISIFELKKLDDQLEERLTMAIPPPRLVENLASVFFFDESENPYRFDRAYGEVKIKKWRSEKLIDGDGIETPYDFFLCLRLQDMIPQWDLSDSDTQAYLKIAGMMDSQHLQTILSMISSSQAKMPIFNYLQYINNGEKITA